MDLWSEASPALPVFGAGLFDSASDTFTRFDGRSITLPPLHQVPLSRSVRDSAKLREGNWYESLEINKSETR